MSDKFVKDKMFQKFCAYGFLKNLRFFDPFILLFFREMGLSFLEIGSLFSIREVAVLLLEIPTGIVADAFGRRRSMVFSFSAYLVSFGIFYFLGWSFWLSAIGMIFFAFGESFRTGTHKAMILDYLGHEGISHLKVAYYGRTRSASQYGSAVSSLIAAVLVFYSGSYRIVFLASTIPYIADLILMTTYPSYLDGEKSSKKLRFSTFWEYTRSSFSDVFKNRTLQKTLLSSSMGSAGFKVTKDYLQPMVMSWVVLLPIMTSVGVEQRTSIMLGIIYFFIYILTAAASRNAPKLVKKTKKISTALNTTFVLTSSMLLLAGASIHFQIYFLSVAAFLILFVIENMRRPIVVGYIGEVADKSRMATILSVDSQFTSLLIACFAPVIGFMTDRLSLGVALGVFGLFLLGISLIFKVSNPDEDKALAD